MKKIVVEKIKNHLMAKGWTIEKIKKLDFWAFHDHAPAFCVVQAGCTLIFFHDLPLNGSWKESKNTFFEMLNGLNHGFSHGVRGIIIGDEEGDVLHVSAVWHNHYHAKEFGQFFEQFVGSIIDLYGNEEVTRHLQPS
ncbi:MAG: hypothetical protein HQL88_02055 [Magnetococcales bacterium]|nr:hypothetical protein [Magnetococcales bacterium]